MQTYTIDGIQQCAVIIFVLARFTSVRLICLRLTLGLILGTKSECCAKMGRLEMICVNR